MWRRFTHKYDVNFEMLEKKASDFEAFETITLLIKTFQNDLNTKNKSLHFIYEFICGSIVWK